MFDYAVSVLVYLMAPRADAFTEDNGASGDWTLTFS